MSVVKKMNLAVSINNLPPEMVEEILKLLNIKEICQSQMICKQWKEIIDKGNLLKKAAGKIFEPLSLQCINDLLIT